MCISIDYDPAYTLQSMFFDGSPFVQISDLYFGLSDARHGSTEKRQARARHVVDLPMLDSLRGKGTFTALCLRAHFLLALKEAIDNLWGWGEVVTVTDGDFY